MNILENREQIEYVVDINPNKQGKYIPVTGQQIVAPEFLTTYRPNVVIVMNPIYVDEIQKTINSMNIAAEIVIV